MQKYSSIKKANSRRISLTRKFILVILAIIFLYGLYFLVPAVARSVIKAAWYPFDSFRVWVAESGSSLPQYLRDRSDLLSEMESLKIRLATEQGTENTIKKLQVENDELRERAGAVPEDRVLARVIGRPNTLPYDLLMLDRGTNHGVLEGAPVFLGADQVIGFVSKVYEKTSLVTLVTTSGFSSSAYIYGPNIYTFAEGMGGGVLRVRVPQGILLQKGDLVLLPAIDSGVYGEVSQIENSATQPEQYGYVTAEIPIQSLYYVSVGKEGITTNSFSEAETLVNKIKTDLFTVSLPPGVLVTPDTKSTSTATSTSNGAGT